MPRISVLPAATAPLDGTELVPMVQGGTTKRGTVSQLVDAVSYAAATFTSLSDTPSAYTGYGALGHAGASVGVNNAQTGLEFKWSTSSYIDIRDYSSTALVSGSDITTAFQAALNDFSNHQQNVYLIPRCGLTGFYIWDPAGTTFSGKDITLLIATRTIKLSSAFVVRNMMHVKDISIDDTFTYSANPGWCPTFVDLNNNITTGLLRGRNIGIQVENVSIDATAGPAIDIFGTNLETWKNIKATTTAAAHAIEINAAFWLNFENIYALPRAAGDYEAIGIYNTSLSPSGTVGGGGTDCGLMRWKDVRLGRAGILFSADVGPVGVRNIEIYDVLGENFVSGNDLLVFDSSGGKRVSYIKVIRPELADQLGTSYCFTNSGSNTNDILIEGPAFVGTQNLINPAAASIKDFTFNGTMGQGAEATDEGDNQINNIWAGTVDWNKWQRLWPNAIDTRLITAPVGLPLVMGSPLKVVEEPTSWTALSGATITAVDGPAGDTGAAGKIVGGAGAEVYRGSHTIAVGDWIIAGVWEYRHGGGAIANGACQIKVTGGDYNGSTAETTFGSNQEDYQTHDGWKWVSACMKVTSIGTQPATITFVLASDNDTTFYNPSAILVSQADGIEDAQMMRLARSLKGGWSSSGAAGDVAFPQQQNVMVKGNYVALQGKKSEWISAVRMTSRTTAGAQATTREINGITLPVLAFDSVSSEGANFTYDFPDSWNRGAITFQPVWTAASGAGTVEFDVRAACFANDAAINTTGFGATITNTDTLITADDVHYMSESSELTLAGPPDESTLGIFEVTRNVGVDTLNADAELLGINLFYNTNSGNDSSVTYDGRVLQFLGFTTDTANQAGGTYTFSSAYIGSAAADRYVVVVAHTSGGATALTSATVAGSAATIAVQANNTVCTAIFGVTVTSGTTGDIVVNWNGSANRCTIGVYALYGLTSTTVSDTDSLNADSLATKRLEVNIPSGGMVIAGAASDSSSDAFTWTNVTENYDTQAESLDTYSGAYLGPRKEHYGFPIVCVTSASNDTVAMAAVWA